MSYNQKTINMIRVMHFNAQGITSGTAINQLEYILKEKQIDIIFINETYLKPYNKFQLLNYVVHREDRSTHGGGVLIAIRNSIPHKRILKFPTTKIENVSISVEINGRPIRFTSAYNPKNTPKLWDDLSKITNSYSDFFIFGDFNAHHTTWNCFNNNSAGTCLYNHQVQSNYYVCFPNDFTRFGQGAQPTRPSVIDILLTNSTLNMSSIETLPGLLNSDHVPIVCEIFGSVMEHKMLVPLYHLANWNSINNWVDNKIRCLEDVNISALNIENILTDVTKIMVGASNKVPVGERQVWQKKLSHLSLYLIGQRNRFRRKLQRCTQTSERPALLCVLKQLNILINQNVSKDRNKNWNDFLQKLPTGKKKFWKIAKAIKGKREAVSQLIVNGAEVHDNVSKANHIADVFENSHQITYDVVSTADRYVNKHIEWLDSQQISNITDELTNKEEIQFYVKSMQNKKAPGKDGIKPIILKKMPDVFFKFIATIFNWCLCNGYFPKQFKKAKVIPILKPGKDKKLPNSYRPISMLNVLDKIFEKIILGRLKDFTDRHCILNKEQFGFRKEHSTVHQLKRVVNIITNNKINRKSTGIIFLDIEKAFDSIWHNGLIFKLNEFNYPIYLQKNNKKFSVRPVL